MYAGTAGLIFATFLFLIDSASAHAGLPLTIDDVAPVPPGQLEIELGFYHGLPDGGGREQRWPVTAVTYGVFNGLEFGLAIQRINQDVSQEAPRRGFEDLHLTAKYKFLDESAEFPALAAAMDVKLPTANRSKGLSTGKADETLLVIATKSLAQLAVNANLGYTIVGNAAGANLKNLIRGGMAMEWPFIPHWSLVGEMTGTSRAARAEPNQADFQLGFRYAALPNLVLDLAAGRSLRPSGTSVQGTFGLTWTVDLKSILKR
jgi:hypothetical protein